jgi:hypothetical protein
MLDKALMVQKRTPRGYLPSADAGTAMVAKGYR